MPEDSKTLIRRALRDLRKAGIPARASTKRPAVLLIPSVGGEGIAALRMLYPALQKITIRTGILPKLPKSK